MSILKHEWQEKRLAIQNLLKKINNFEYDYWIKEFGIKKEFKQKVPPMITIEWRSIV